MIVTPRNAWNGSVRNIISSRNGYATRRNRVDADQRPEEQRPDQHEVDVHHLVHEADRSDASYQPVK